MKRSLLLGCGNSRAKQVQYDGADWLGELTTVDLDPNCGADILFDMEGLGKRSWRHPFKKKLPFADNTFDDMGAFNTMEHWGVQGDFRGWFAECAEYWRVLKPGGLFYILVPIGEDALADPGHTRFFQANWFGFLSQEFYKRNEAIKSCYTDYTWIWKLDFDVLYCTEHDGHHLAVVLRKKA